MSNYTKTTNFTAKDALTSGDPNKIVKGSLFDTEFDNLATASATKANKVVSGTSSAVVIQTAGGDLADGGKTLPSGALVGISDTQTLTNKSIDSDNNTITNIVNADIKAAAAIDATKIGDGTVTSIEFQYLGGVTSAIQTQIDGKVSASGLVDLSGVTDTATARTNLGLGDVALLASVGGDDLTAPATGSILLIGTGAESTGTHTSMTRTQEIYCPTSGTIKVRFQMKATNTGSSISGRIYVNSVATGTTRSTNSASYVTYDENIAVSAGDLIQIYSTGVGSNYVFIYNLQLFADSSPYYANTYNL